MAAPHDDTGDVPGLDEHLRTAQRDLYRFRWTMVAAAGIGLLIALVALGALLVQDRAKLHADDLLVHRDEKRLTASCQFYFDLAGLPVTVNPATQKATELSVRIVVDSRGAWIREGCMGRLPVADVSVRRWAAYYHLPVP